MFEWDSDVVDTREQYHLIDRELEIEIAQSKNIEYILKAKLENREIKWFKDNYLKKMNISTQDGRIKKLN
ncbi:hypothetical protein [Paraclostridium bifermentans]|nr:hypothetical protein [Paraclostridium bifermentans]GKZ02650.1 hypothetical protein ANS014_10840 [Paraclostridium bifermentans]GKZ07419.1 hypothetical protein ANS015_23020 [Paraclostridium bifermentans]